MSGFKVGDLVVVTNATGGYEMYNGVVAKIISGEKGVPKEVSSYWNLDTPSLSKMYSPRFYNSEIELEHVYNSPLNQALR